MIKIAREAQQKMILRQSKLKIPLRDIRMNSPSNSPQLMAEPASANRLQIKLSMAGIFDVQSLDPANNLLSDDGIAQNMNLNPRESNLFQTNDLFIDPPAMFDEFDQLEDPVRLEESVEPMQIDTSAFYGASIPLLPVLSPKADAIKDLEPIIIDNLEYLNGQDIDFNERNAIDEIDMFYQLPANSLKQEQLDDEIPY